ncbi:hypothetical protein MTO96_001954 [Rhipicephalus appendiculatus]
MPDGWNTLVCRTNGHPFGNQEATPSTKCLLCSALLMFTQKLSHKCVALHALFILIPSEKAPPRSVTYLNFVCSVLNAVAVWYPVNALPCERNGRLWDLSVIRPTPHGHHIRGKPSILKVPMISVACKKLAWNELFDVTLHTPKHSITVAIVRGARMLFLISVLL